MTSIETYLQQLPEDRIKPFIKLLNTINEHIPQGFSNEIQYKMPSWVVPLSIFPSGYHCAKGNPLPFVSIANQKNFIALYHMGLYSTPELLEWFVAAYPKHSRYKLDMGKSCIRFKKVDDIPYELIAALMGKMTVDDWIDRYQVALLPTK